MNFQLIAVFLAVAVAAGRCEIELATRLNGAENETGLGIYDGTPTTIEEHPYLVGIVVDADGDFSCAGTIVSDSWIVTIGSCGDDYPFYDYTVVAASSDGVTGKTYRVEAVTLHPDFAHTFDYNFACMKIKGKFQWSNKIKPIKLPNNDPKANTDMVVAGWGDTSNENKRSLMQGNMNWLDIKACKKAYADYSFPWTSRMGCAYNKSKTTLCKGDWGDAFVFNEVFYGMFAAAETEGMCTSYAIPVIAANIYSVAPWIKKVTGAKFENE